MFKRAGEQEALHAARLAKPLRHEPYLARRWPAVLAGAMGPLLDGVVVAYEKTICLYPSGLQLRTMTDFGSSIDELWRLSRRDGLCLGERNSRYMRWRFSEGPSREKWQGFEVFERRTEQPIGYVVGHAQEGAFVLHDMLFNVEGSSLVRCMEAAISDIRRAGLSSVSVSTIVDPAAKTALKRLGFTERAPGVVFIDRRVFSSATRWHLTEADLDA